MPMLRRLIPVTALLAVATGARAQDYEERRGAGATIGIGASSAGVNCTPQCGGDRYSGPTYLLRGTAAVTPQLTLAAEADEFQQNIQTQSGPGNWRMVWIMLEAIWYLREEEGIYVKAGFGSAQVRANATFPTVGAIDLNATNIGFVAGVGRDFRLTSNFGVTLYADYLSTPRTVSYLNGAQQNARMGADVLNIGLGFSVF